MPHWISVVVQKGSNQITKGQSGAGNAASFRLLSRPFCSGVSGGGAAFLETSMMSAAFQQTAHSSSHGLCSSCVKVNARRRYRQSGSELQLQFLKGRYLTYIFHLEFYILSGVKLSD